MSKKHPTQHPTKRIHKGLYLYRGLYLVATNALGADSILDWVAVHTEKAAVKILHGNKPPEYEHIDNTKRDIKNLIDRTLDRPSRRRRPNGIEVGDL